MGVEDADKLQDMITQARALPVWASNNVSGYRTGTNAQVGMYGKSLRDIATWVAMRESDRDELRSLISWPADREYRVDPLPDRIAQSFSDLLFGEDPTFIAPADGDQDSLDDIVEENDLPSELRRWASDASSEGEIWWRIYVDKNMSHRPIIEAHSRLDVIPYFVGRRIAAAAFVSDIIDEKVMIEGQLATVVWRHIEIQTEGYSRNLLYRGSLAGLGVPVPLTDRVEVEDLPEEWPHDLPYMLAGRIPNKLGRDWRIGISDYQGIKDLLLDLNEARSIMAENARNTMKSRMIVPTSALDEDGNFDAGTDVIPAESTDNVDLGGNNKGPFAVLEYTYQAAPIIEHIDSLVSTALTRVGLAEQFTGGGRQMEGQSFSGTALRTRMIPTTLAASGKARFFDDAVPKILRCAAAVDSLPSEKGGCGNSWSNVSDLPSMERSDVLPEDAGEETNRHVAAVGGEIESVETAVRAMHKDWSDKDVEDELQRIKDDRDEFGIGAPKPPPPGGIPGPGAVPTPNDNGNGATPDPALTGQPAGGTPEAAQQAAAQR